MSNFEQYQVNGVSKTPTNSPTQILLTVVPKPNTNQHTPVSTITLAKGIPSGGANRCGQEDPKDIAAVVYLNTTDFNTACNRTFTFVNYYSNDVPSQPIETITNFNF